MGAPYMPSEIIPPGAAPLGQNPAAGRLAFVISAHGGAGTTTVCRWLGSNFVQDWGMAVPPHIGDNAVVVACQATPHGAARSAELIRYLRLNTDCNRLLLVATADGRGPEPLASKARIRTLSAYIDGVVRLPYIQRWRYMDDPLSQPAPSNYFTQLNKVREFLADSCIYINY